MPDSDENLTADGRIIKFEIDGEQRHVAVARDPRDGAFLLEFCRNDSVVRLSLSATAGQALLQLLLETNGSFHLPDLS